MNETIGKNQSIARELNNQLVLKQLREKPMSGTELAERLSLSNATVSSILRSLLASDIIHICANEQTHTKGRKRVSYSINQDYGLILVFSITSYHSHPIIANLLGENLYESDHEIANYSLPVFEKEIENVEEVLKRSVFKNIPIRSVIISLPGLVNSKTGDLQVSPQFDQDLFSNSHALISLFENAFHCPVTLENDTKLMMMAELAKGSFSKGSSGLLAYIDYGIGGAFKFDDKLYWGARGYAGEIGRLVVKVDGESHHLDDFASLRAIQEHVSKKKGKNISITSIYESFAQGDEDVVKEVVTSARSVGKALKEIIRVFDIDQFILSGGITNFGDEYLKYIEEETKMANENATVIFSTLNNYAICDGAKEMGISKVLSTVLANMKNQ